MSSDLDFHRPPPRTPGRADNAGLRLHPLVSIPLAILILIVSYALFEAAYRPPEYYLPPQIQKWPSAIADVVHRVAIDEGRSTDYECTMRYEVDGTKYWFIASSSLPLHLSEVRYDPIDPSHYRRLNLKAEGMTLYIYAFFIALLGLGTFFSGVEKIRQRDYSFNLFTSIAFGFFAVLLGMGEFTLYFNPTLHKDGQPDLPSYEQATLTDPGKFKTKDPG